MERIDEVKRKEWKIEEEFSTSYFLNTFFNYGKKNLTSGGTFRRIKIMKITIPF